MLTVNIVYIGSKVGRSSGPICFWLQWFQLLDPLLALHCNLVKFFYKLTLDFRQICPMEATYAGFHLRGSQGRVPNLLLLRKFVCFPLVSFSPRSSGNRNSPTRVLPKPESGKKHPNALMEPPSNWIMQEDKLMNFAVGHIRVIFQSPSFASLMTVAVVVVDVVVVVVTYSGANINISSRQQVIETSPLPLLSPAVPVSLEVMPVRIHYCNGFISWCNVVIGVPTVHRSQPNFSTQERLKK